MACKLTLSLTAEPSSTPWQATILLVKALKDLHEGSSEPGLMQELDSVKWAHL